MAVDGDRRIRAVRVPPTIQALLAARLDRLDDRRASCDRACRGRGQGLLRGSGRRPRRRRTLRPAVAESLGALVRKELIRPDRPSLGERTYRFRHLLIRDAAYESIPKEARAELHERFGRWLERAAATARSSTRRSSATTSSRRTATGPSWARRRRDARARARGGRASRQRRPTRVPPQRRARRG